MSTALVLVHGRSQQLPKPLRGDRSRVDAHVDSLRRGWLAGLAQGLLLANRPPIEEKHVVFPFYGNRLADLVESRAARGSRAPDLEVDETADAAATRDQLVLETAARLGFDPAAELSYTDPALGERVPSDLDEIDWSAGLRIPVVRSALAFLARKTGTPDFVIEEYLSDVAFYLADEEVRGAVLGVVREALAAARETHDEVVVVSHSLGTVVAYDLLRSAAGPPPAGFLVTAGSPLGLPAVHRNLVRGGGAPVVPLTGRGGQARWLNVYDVRDVVALIHPLRDVFRPAAAVRDVVTHNPTGPHSIRDYLSDPDVASAISRAAT